MPIQVEPPLPEGAQEESLTKEADLVRRLRAGEEAAFEEFYREFRRMVAANLFRVMGEQSELDDLVQEVFLIAYRGFAKFRGEAKLSTWLYRICVNVALGRLRSRSRRPVLGSAPKEIELSFGDAEPVETPERLLSRREDIARVYRALDTLSPKKRVVLVLHEIEGLDVKEIAQIVSAPLVTVRTRLHYARKDFFQAVARLAEEEGR